MSKLRWSSTPNSQFPSLLLLFFFFLFVFSPCFLKSLVLLVVLLTFYTPGLLLRHDASAHLLVSETKAGIIVHNLCRTIVERLRSATASAGNQVDFGSFEELEPYKTAFDPASTILSEDANDCRCPCPIDIFQVSEVKPRNSCFLALESDVLVNNLTDQHDEFVERNKCEDPIVRVKGNSDDDQVSALETSCSNVMEESNKIDRFEKAAICNVKEPKKNEAFGLGVKPNKAVGDHEEEKESNHRGGSEEATYNKIGDDALCNTDEGRKYESKAKGNALNLGAISETLDYNLGNYGSTRKKKDWSRTLACKLFEERNKDDGSGEGMDSLWETYEVDSRITKPKKGNTQKSYSSKKTADSECHDRSSFIDDDNEEEKMTGELCCLQALKLSAGKMNLGMGRPHLSKISNAIKGIGLLYDTARNGKKKGNRHGRRSGQRFI